MESMIRVTKMERDLKFIQWNFRMNEIYIPKGEARLMVLGFMAPHLALQRVDTTTSVGSMHLKAMHKPYQ